MLMTAFRRKKAVCTQFRLRRHRGGVELTRFDGHLGEAGRIGVV